MATSAVNSSTSLAKHRPDLAGLNLVAFPSILVECGNMKNAQEAAQMESVGGRVTYAAAVARGITAYLGQLPV